MIKVQINKICAKLVECEPLTAGMIGKTLEVEFSADWAAYTKTAVFSNGDTTIDVLESQWDGNTITIPAEVLAVPSRTVLFGVYGFAVENGTTVALPTIYAKIGIPMVGADPESDPTTDPSLPVYAQLQWQIDHFEISDEQIAEQVQQYLDEHPIEIQPATESVLGGVKVGNGLSVTPDGTLSADGTDAYTKAETDALLADKQPVGDYATSGELDALADIVDGKADAADIPTKTSELTNDSGFLTEHQSLAGYATESYVQNYHDNTKQDTIADLASIRSGAALGATSVQPNDLADYAEKSDLKAIGRACYNLLAKAVYTEDVTALMSVLWALVGANLVSISAVFTQGATVVYPTTALDSLKSMLVVTATYDDSTTAEINDYTLSGTLAEGTSTITATYNGKTATFNVNVSAEPVIPVLDYITAVYTQSSEVYESTALDDLKADLVVTAHLTDASTQTIASNDYTLSGTLSVGTSVVTVSYEGKTTTFNVTVSSIPVVTYTITNNLTNCTNSNNAVSINEGEGYFATITANEGYALDSVVCTMGGVSQSVVDGVISIASVTGNILITASAVVPTPTTQYALHNTGGTDARFNVGKKTTDFDTVQMTFELTTFTGTKVLFSKLNATSGWSGIKDGAFLNMNSDKTVDEILGQGKVTANFVITQGYAGDEYYTGFTTTSFNPEYTLYEIKLLKNGEVTHDWKPTATVGEMYDSVTQTTRNFTSTNGLSVSEVTA